MDKGLKSGALGLLSSVVIGLAATAPAYSLAATLGSVVVAVGVQAPSVMLLAFVPSLLIAVACQELNRAEPDCGTTFTWAAKAFGPRVGWMGGWGMIAADIVAMAGLAQIAGQYAFLLLGADGLAQSTLWITVAGVVWIALMTWVCYCGITLSVRTQYVLLSVELLMLLSFSVVALVRVYSGSTPDGSITPALSWFNPFAISSPSTLANGVLLAVFIYWGWDAALSVNEETTDRERAPGRAAVFSTVLLLITYAVVTVAAQAYAGTSTKGLGLGNPNNSGDVLAALGESVFGSGLMSKLLIFATLTSAAASVQTTILPTARAMLSMAAYRALPRMFGRIHAHYLTPSVSTVVMGVVSVFFYVGLTVISGNVLADSVKSIGLMIAFYYGVTGFACVWQFRRQLLCSFRDLLFKGVLPVLGGLLMLAAFVKSAFDMFSVDYGQTSFAGIGGVFLLGIGPLLLGLVLMVAYNLVAPDYFHSEVFTHGTHLPIADGAGVAAASTSSASLSPQQIMLLPENSPQPPPRQVH